MPCVIGSDRRGASAKSYSSAHRRHAADAHVTYPDATNPWTADANASSKRVGVSRDCCDTGYSHDNRCEERDCTTI